MNLGKYQHSKSGKFYEVTGVARNSENPEEELVVYRALYNHPKFGNNILWVRPKKMFLVRIVIDDEQVPRFRFVGNKPPDPTTIQPPKL